MRRSDLLIGALIGLIVGIALVIAFVFGGGAEQIDSPALTPDASLERPPN